MRSTYFPRLGLVLSAAFVFATACTASNADRADPSVNPTSGSATADSLVKTYSAETFHETTRHRGSSFSADGQRVLFSSDATGIFNVYSVGSDGGTPVQLTHSQRSATNIVSTFPNDDRVLVSADGEGNEIGHLYVADQTGQLTDLVDNPRARVGFMRFSADDQSMFVISSERDPKFPDLYRYQLSDLSRELVLASPRGLEIVGVSSNGRYVALQQFVTNADSNILLVDTQSEDKTPKLVTPHEGSIQHMPLNFSPDGSTFYYASNQGSEFKRAWAIDLASGKHSLAIDTKWDIKHLSFSRLGRYMAYTINEEAKTKLTIVDTKTGEPIALPPFPRMNILGVRFSRDEKKAAFYAGSDVSPPDLYTLSLSGSSEQKPLRLTRSLTEKIDPSELVEGEHIRYESFDGLQIPALLYRTRSASAQSPKPAIVLVHGGPGGQSRHGYHADLQYLVNQGYTVLAVNNRGSSGYGKTFNHMDDRKHGDVDLDDCVWAHKFLAKQDYVRAEHIGIMGGSYGGYMTAAALAFRPEVFAAGIDIFGVTNWQRTLASIPDWWESYRKALYTEMGDPATDGERHYNMSPLFFPQNFKRPLLVIQGANDPRVLKVESDELVAAVKKQGVPVGYVVFPDEGHGFEKKANRITASKAFIKFLSQHMPADLPTKATAKSPQT